MQLQMLVTEKEHCDFFVWSKKNFISIRVIKDETFCESLKNKIEIVFMKVILPELVTRNKDPANTEYQKLYCYCNRPCFKPMIGCDNDKCKLSWFHYSCVNILRTPNENTKWFCPDCIKTRTSKKSKR